MDNTIQRIRSKINNSGVMYVHNEEDENQLLKELHVWRQKTKEEYVKSLLFPEEHKGAKVPTMAPAESATASIHYPLTITPNGSGKFLLVIDPVCQAGFLYQDATVNGTGSGSVTNLTFTQDSTVIDEWRLVSSSLVLKYYGNFQNMSGFFVAATTSNRDAATQTTFLTFQNVEDLTNKEVLRAVDGVKLIFIPSDTLTTEFQSQTVYSGNTHPARWQNLFVIYGDAFPNTSCIRVDYHRNIEYKAKPAYKEYIAHSRGVPCEQVSIQEKTVLPAPSQKEKSEINKLINSSANVILSELSKAYPQIGKDVMNPFFGAPNMFNDRLNIFK